MTEYEKPKGLLTFAEASIAANRHINTIRRYVRSGILPVVRYGHSCAFIKPSDLNKIGQ